jgi:hypothetical protein
LFFHAEWLWAFELVFLSIAAMEEKMRIRAFSFALGTFAFLLWFFSRCRALFLASRL